MDSRNRKHVPNDEYLYAVLNVSKYASQAEINERHRSLSLIFHPDRQTDPEVKETATKEFLEIQKAYQVLSDSFLRQVYDTLGPEGLALQWPPSMHSKSKEEVREILEQNKINLARQRLRQFIIPKGVYSCSIDASPIFSSPLSSNYNKWGSQLLNCISNTRSISQSFNYSLEKKINEKVTVVLESQNSSSGFKASNRFLGTVRYQFSPRLVAAATLNPGFPSAKLEVHYEDPDNTLDVKTILTPLLFATTPPTTISFSRRLFRTKPQRGKIDLHLGKQPSLSLYYVSPPTVDLPEDEGPSSMQNGPPSTFGFKYIAFERTFGLMFDAIIPRLFAETSVIFVELSARLKASIQFGPSQLLVILGASWSNETASISSDLILNPTALILRLDLTYLEQQLSLPIILSTHFSFLLSLGTVIVPSTAAVLGYHFFVVPWRRARRIAHIKAAKKAFEEDTDSRKERNAVESLLKDAVRKHIRGEKEREGLVIQEATYGAADAELAETKDNLLLDVTIPLQALVRNSQLHISGGNTKAAIQGFSDPAPFASKLLRIRYTFRGRVHYAEIPDYLPVVLPLAEHQVKGL